MRLPSGVPVSEPAPVAVAVDEGVALAASVTVRVEPGDTDRVPEAGGLRDTDKLPDDEPLVEMVADGGALALEPPPLTLGEPVVDGCARDGVAAGDPESESERDALPAAAIVEAGLALTEGLDERTRDAVAKMLADEFAEHETVALSRPLFDANDVGVDDMETDAETRLLRVFPGADTEVEPLALGDRLGDVDSRGDREFVFVADPTTALAVNAFDRDRDVVTVAVELPVPDVDCDVLDERVTLAEAAFDLELHGDGVWLSVRAVDRDEHGDELELGVLRMELDCVVKGDIDVDAEYVALERVDSDAAVDEDGHADAETL